jgi:hypothetical protein
MFRNRMLENSNNVDFHLNYLVGKYIDYTIARIRLYHYLHLDDVVNSFLHYYQFDKIIEDPFHEKYKYYDGEISEDRYYDEVMKQDFNLIDKKAKSAYYRALSVFKKGKFISGEGENILNINFSNKKEVELLENLDNKIKDKDQFLKESSTDSDGKSADEIEYYSLNYILYKTLQNVLIRLIKEDKARSFYHLRNGIFDDIKDYFSNFQQKVPVECTND